MGRKLLFDLGAHHGNSLLKLENMLGIDAQWEIHFFEPNPACFLVDRMRDSRFNCQVHSSAAWVYNGFIEFSQQNHQVARNNSPTDGRSEVDGWGSRISSLQTTHPSLMPPISVQCVDSAELLRPLEKDDFVVVKMDIEGAEFPVLRHLVKQRLIGRVNILLIEWHVRLLPNESVASRDTLVAEIRRSGVQINHWD